MSNLKPLALLDLIDRGKLDDVSLAVYDGTRKFIGTHEAKNLNLTTTGTYHLKCTGVLSEGGYFSFMGYHNAVFADYLRPLPSELLETARDDELMKIISDAERDGFQVGMPMAWIGARQMNEGLYEGAAQFEITPPCLRIGTSSKPDETVQKICRVEYSYKVI